MSSAEGTWNWEERMLCPNESCIGVLSIQKKCSLCGWDQASASFLPLENASLEQKKTEESLESLEEREEDFSDRQLCPNDRCIGVLNQNNQCPLCGCTV